MSGDTNAAWPAASASAATATIFMPRPPARSGTASPDHPSSTICCHRPSSHGAGGTALSHACL
jgi:hypothetical protein